MYYYGGGSFNSFPSCGCNMQNSWWGFPSCGWSNNNNNYRNKLNNKSNKLFY